MDKIRKYAKQCGLVVAGSQLQLMYDHSQSNALFSTPLAWLSFVGFLLLIKFCYEEVK